MSKNFSANTTTPTAASLTTAIFDALDQQTLVLAGTAAVRAGDRGAGRHAGPISTRNITDWKSEIAEVFRRHPFAQILLSMTGIGVKIGTAILVEIGDISNFETAGHLASYAGLAPHTNSPVRASNPRPDHVGNRRLKAALFLTTFCSIHADGEGASTRRSEPMGNTTTRP